MQFWKMDNARIAHGTVQPQDSTQTKLKLNTTARLFLEKTGQLQAMENFSTRISPNCVDYRIVPLGT